MQAAAQSHRRIFAAIAKGDAEIAEQRASPASRQVEDFYWSAKSGNTAAAPSRAASREGKNEDTNRSGGNSRGRDIRIDGERRQSRRNAC